MKPFPSIQSNRSMQAESQQTLLSCSSHRQASNFLKELSTKKTGICQTINSFCCRCWKLIANFIDAMERDCDMGIFAHPLTLFSCFHPTLTFSCSSPHPLWLFPSHTLLSPHRSTYLQLLKPSKLLTSRSAIARHSFPRTPNPDCCGGPRPRPSLPKPANRASSTT
jgi:hypothetical protein